MSGLLPLQLEEFASGLGQSLEVCDAEGQVLTTTLVEAEALTHPPALQGRQAFSLLFAGPLQTPWPQGTYRVTGGGRPAIDIFLVPIAADAASVHYQAVFA